MINNPQKGKSSSLYKNTTKELCCNNSVLSLSYLRILTVKDWCFTQFSTGMAGWLRLIFLICLHNQLSSIHSIISTNV